MMTSPDLQASVPRKKIYVEQTANINFEGQIYYRIMRDLRFS